MPDNRKTGDIRQTWITPTTKQKYGTLNGDTKEWFLLDWYELPGSDLLWHRWQSREQRDNPSFDWFKHGNVRFVIENTRGMSELRRLTGFGANLRIEWICDKSEPRLTRDTFCGFERYMMRVQEPNAE
jgi:hypothetical protein